MTAQRDWRRFWRYQGGHAAPGLLWVLRIYLLVDTFRSRLHGDERCDESALREWVEESRPFRETAACGEASTCRVSWKLSVCCPALSIAITATS